MGFTFQYLGEKEPPNNLPVCHSNQQKLQPREIKEFTVSHDKPHFSYVHFRCPQIKPKLHLNLALENTQKTSPRGRKNPGLKWCREDWETEQRWELFMETDEKMEWKCNTESSSSLWLKNREALNRLLLRMHLQRKPQNPIESVSASEPNGKIQGVLLTNLVQDKTSLLSDEIMIKILGKLPRCQRNANFLVCKRWLNLQGRLVRSVKILSWEFLVSGRLFLRFPNLVSIDLVNGSLVSANNLGVCSTHKIVSYSYSVGSRRDWIFDENVVMNDDEIDKGLRVLVNGFPNLRKLVVINAGEMGLLNVAEECSTLQELELHMCSDHVLAGLAACKNLQILRAIASVDGLYDSSVSDFGLTVLAEGCRRLVKLELSGCRGSYNGICSIGQCCPMLEELILCNHGMDDGWLSAIPYFNNLKTLTRGLETVIATWDELESLRVKSCRGVKAGEVSDAMCGVFSGLKNLKWEADVVWDDVVRMGLGKKGGKLLGNWKSLHNHTPQSSNPTHGPL